MKTILFQGDSITDVGRVREDESSLGQGYPRMLAERLGYEYPGQFRYLNRGISGNRVVDLYARWKVDALNLKPDYLSILIGVNDVWHEIEAQNGVEAKKYEKIYTMLLEETLEALPDIKIILMEPFVLHGTGTDKAWDVFSQEVAAPESAYVPEDGADTELLAPLASAGVGRFVIVKSITEIHTEETI